MATRETAAAPVRVKDATAENGWADIDLDLARNPDGTVSPKVPLTDVTLNGGGSDDSDLIEYQGPKDKSFSLDWDGPLPEPSLDGSVATYADVAPDIDLQVTATRFGFEESFIVKERPDDPSSIELPLSIGTDGLSVVDASKSPQSGMKVEDSDGNTVVSVSPAETWDASVDRSGQPDNVTVSDLTLDSSDSGTNLVVKPDENYLSDPQTQYPVVIDPTFTVGTKSGIADTYVASGNPNANMFTSTDLNVGTYDNGTTKTRSYFNFVGPRIDDRLVYSASLSVWNFSSWSCTPSALEVYASSVNDLTAATWNKQPTINTATKSSVTGAFGSNGCGAGWLTLNVTSATQYWANQHSSYYSYGLRASETNVSGWKRLDSSDGTNVPVLQVTYDSPPTTPTNMYVLPTAGWGGRDYTSTSSPALVGYTSDAEGNPARLAYEVWDGSSTTSNSRVATCTSTYVDNSAAASCNPTPALVDTREYYVRAQAQSAVGGLNSDWSDLSALRFRTSLNDPQAPTIDCGSVYSNGSWNTTTPSNPVSCTIATTGGNGYSAPVVVSGDVDGTPFSQQVAMGAAMTFQVSVPATDGQHTVRAQSYSAVGRTQASPVTYTFGYGRVSALSSPTIRTTTTNYVNISGAAPPRGSSSISVTLRWRAAGSGTWSADVTVPNGSISPGTGSTPVTVNGYRWSSLTATGQGMSPRRPTLIDIQLCFTYSSPAKTLCTDGSGSVPTVLRVPHAFGDGFPSAAAGEGTVALWTGELAIDAPDVKIAANLGTLAVTRSHSSFLDAQDAVTGVFGPGWSASFGDDGDATSLQVEDSTTVDGTIAFATADDDPLVFREGGYGTVSAPAGTYIPVGDAAITSGYTVAVTGTGNGRQLVLTGSDGTVSTWVPVDGTASQLTWAPLSTTQPEKHSTVTYTSDSAGRVTRILAPVPNGVTCGSGTDLAAGCSALFINYTASGSAGRVGSIDYRAWDPATSAMKTTTVETYTYDTNGRLTTATDARLGLSTAYEYATYGGNLVVTKVTHDGLAPVTYSYDTATAKLAKVSRDAATSGGQSATVASYVYGVSPSTSGLPDLTAAQVAKWGQTRVPTAASAVFGMDHPVSSTNPADIAASDWQNATLHYTDDDGYETDTDEYGTGRWLTTASFYDDAGRPTTTLDANNTYAAANGTLTDVNAGKSFTRWNADVLGTGGVVLVPAHTYVLDSWGPVVTATVSGQTQSIRVHTHYDYDEGAPNSDLNSATGKPYQLVTTTTVGVSAPVNYSESPTATLAADSLITKVSKNGYDPIDGTSAVGTTSGWTLGKPTVTTIVMPNSADNIVTKMRYDADGNVLESREPGSSGTDAGTTKSVYYTASTNTDDAACGNVPQWAGLSCWTGPAAPPESGTDIPDSRTSSYDRWLHAATTVETSGSGSGQATRTTTQTYLADGRLDTTTAATTNLAGSTALPTTRALYDSATKVRLGTANLNSSGTQTSAVTSTIDLWGRTTSYTDASGNTTNTSYVAPGGNGAGSVSSVTNAKGTSTYTYDGTDAAGKVEHRGLATQLVTTGLGTYNAAYDATGKLVTETMPGSLSQQRTYDTAGRLTGLTYSGQGGTWLGYTRTYNGAGQVDIDSDTTGRSTAFSYDRAARLASAADTTANAAAQTSTCVTRGYSFDVRGNRTSLATSNAATCTTSGATTTTWAYDSYSRQLTGANGTGSYVYDAFGRQTTVPASDAANASNAATTVTYFSNDAAQSITQSGTSTTFELDPAGRRLTSATSAATQVNAYSDTSDSPDWVTKTAGSTVTTSRYIADLAGGLANVDTTGSTTTTSLQLATPGGAIAAVVTVPASGAATGISSYSTCDEYGRALTGSPSTGAARYGWLGTAQRELTDTGLMLMGARLYNPTTGRFTSIDPVPGGNENTYVYPNDPVNQSDTNGCWNGDDTFGVVMVVLTVLDFVPGIDVFSGAAEIGLLALRAASAASKISRASRIVSRASRFARSTERVEGKIKQNEGAVKAVSAKVAHKAGMRWVGKDATHEDGAYMSSDGTRQYRVGKEKRNQPVPSANLEYRSPAAARQGGQNFSKGHHTYRNYHLPIK